MIAADGRSTWSFGVAEEQDGWKNSLAVARFYSCNAAFATAERLEGRYELDHKISGRPCVSGAPRGEHDLFRGFA